MSADYISGFIDRMQRRRLKAQGSGVVNADRVARRQQQITINTWAQRARDRG